MLLTEKSIKLFHIVIDDLVKHKAEVIVEAEKVHGGIDYTILATFPSGEKWQIRNVEDTRDGS